MNQTSMAEIAIGLGSNLGDRLENLRRARALVAQWPEACLTETAPVYETLPVDVPAPFADQYFLNSMLLIESAAEPAQIMAFTKAIEKCLGRNREGMPRNGPRTIDLDLIYAGDMEINLPDFQIPHPRWTERAFVVRPLADLRPDRILPGETRPVQAILQNLNDQGIQRYADCPWW